MKINVSLPGAYIETAQILHLAYFILERECKWEYIAEEGWYQTRGRILLFCLSKCIGIPYDKKASLLYFLYIFHIYTHNFHLQRITEIINRIFNNICNIIINVHEVTTNDNISGKITSED